MITTQSHDSHAMQPPQAVVSVLGAMVGQSRAAIDPSVQQIFRSAIILCLHCSHACEGMTGTAKALHMASITDTESA